MIKKAFAFVMTLGLVVGLTAPVLAYPTLHRTPVLFYCAYEGQFRTTYYGGAVQYCVPYYCRDIKI